MALKNYTTTISVEKTISEIQGKLAYIGARRIMSEYDDSGNIIALSFQLELNGQLLAFSLPTDYRPVAAVLKKQRAVPDRRLEEQARRTAWRITKDWIDAQVAIIETKMVTTTQVFLPYAITHDGNSVYQRFLTNSNLMLGDGADDKTGSNYELSQSYRSNQQINRGESTL